MQHLTDKKLSIPLILLVVCFLSYGMLIPTLGLYWDGWPYLWQYHVFGSSGFPQFVSSDRPYSAWIFMLVTWLFGTNLIWYHLAIFIFRWLSACFVWWTLNLIWEEKWLSNSIVALLFLIYPGFLQQPISLPYIHHISHMALFFFSFWAMLFSLRNPKKFWWLIVISVLTSVIVNFSLEYFTPLEIVRPAFIYMYFNNKVPKKTRLKNMVISWLPYLAGLLFFLGWRIFVFRFPTYSPMGLDQLASSPVNQPDNLILTFLNSLVTVSITAWSKVFHFPTISEFGTSATYLYYLLVGASTIAILTVLFILDKRNQKEDRHLKFSHRDYPIFLIAVGVFAILMPALMYWILKLPILVEFAWDRLNLSFAFGVSLLFTGLIESFQKISWLKISIVTLLVSLAIGFHFQNGMSYKRDWETFQEFFWQLTWRAPDLQKGTVILTTNFPLRYYSDNSLTAPLNWAYDPDNKSAQLNYLFYFTDVRLESKRLSSLSKNQPIQQPYRSFFFEGNTNQSLVIKYSPPGCLQVLDLEYANSGILPNLTQLEADAIKLSNLSQIITEPNVEKKPPVELFTKPPVQNWCYFFEKADLARQSKDWEKVIKLGSEAYEQNLTPRNPSEWLPFIEAYTRTDDFQKAKSLIDTSITDKKYLSGICYTMKRISKDTQINESTRKQIQQWEAEYNCSR